MRLIFIVLMAFLLSGCANRGFFRGAVDGEKMIKAQVTEGSGGAWYKPFAEAQAGVDSVVIESTTEEITGVTIRVQTESVYVEVIK